MFKRLFLPLSFFNTTLSFLILFLHWFLFFFLNVRHFLSIIVFGGYCRFGMLSLLILLFGTVIFPTPIVVLILFFSCLFVYKRNPTDNRGGYVSFSFSFYFFFLNNSIVMFTNFCCCLVSISIFITCFFLDYCRFLLVF